MTLTAFLAAFVPTRLDLLHLAQWVGCVLFASGILLLIAVVIGKTLAELSPGELDESDSRAERAGLTALTALTEAPRRQRL